jgi:hypothetical protein
MQDEVTDDRTSLKMREALWYEIIVRGFTGRVLDKLDKALRKRRRFDVVEMARRSDVNSQFNATALGAVAHCQLGRKKYDRGLLCSDASLRRTQKRVLQLAGNLGFSSFPTEDEGKVWCWDDDHGEFVTGVNRYVYETYVKA